MCDIQDKGKGPYSEISTILSEYLVIQVQESIKSNHELTVMSGNAVLSSLITNCIHVVLLVLQKGLIYEG